MPQITLAPETLEALAAETRVRLLKALVGRQQTLAQLTRTVERDKAVVHRHLQKLLKGGFVERDDSYSITYYRLTWRGRGVVAPSENSRIALALGFSAVAALLAVWAGASLLAGQAQFTMGGSHGSVLESPLFLVVSMAVSAAALARAVRWLRPPRLETDPIQEQAAS